MYVATAQSISPTLSRAFKSNSIQDSMSPSPTTRKKFATTSKATTTTFERTFNLTKAKSSRSADIESPQHTSLLTKTSKVTKPGIFKSRVTINISGEIFETYAKTLNKFPETLLGNEERLKTFFCHSTKQYFFHRNRLCFGAILYFYQSSGMLTCPLDIKVEDFERECIFFELPECSIQKMKMKRGILIEEENDDEKEDENVREEVNVSTRKHMKQIWKFLEKPESSRCASVYAIISLVMVFLSVVIACMETVGSLKKIPWESYELWLNVWFGVELIVRTIFCPNKYKYLTSLMTWVDILAVVPFFITNVFIQEKIDSLSFLRIIRFLKIMRLFRLSKHSKRLKIIGSIIKSSVGDLQLLLLCLSILMIFGGSVMYHVESRDSITQFTSIPQSLWWAVQTITTLGYGDITPRTEIGKILAASFMLFGAVTISLPVLSIVAKFTLIYGQNTE